MSEITSKMLAKKQIAHDTWMFTFEKKFTEHKAGQYTTIFLGNDNRDFTIASSPLDEKSFSFVTKKGMSDFKKKLFALKIGNSLKMLPPVGGFVLRENTRIPQIFLAGGIGITPFYSMIRYAHEKKLSTPLTLMVSFSKRENIIFYDELQKIQKENPHITIVYTLSQDTWDKETGRISPELVKKYVTDMHHGEFLIAGGEQMVEHTEQMILDMGIDSSNIRIDIFTGY